MSWKVALFFSSAALLTTPAHAEWWEARSEHFIVYSEGEKAEVEELTLSLERYDMAMRSVQKIASGKVSSDSQRPTIFRTGKQAQIAALYGSSNSGVAGFYIPRAGGSVAFVPARSEIGESRTNDPATELNSLTVLYHEYAHYFMLNNFPATYPSWYVEGFAELYGNIELLDDGVFKLGKPPQYRGYDLFQATPYPVKRLFEDRTELEYRDVLARYSLGWLMIHYLTFANERPGQLTKYLDLINRGRSSKDAATESFGDLGKLDSDLRRHLRGKLPGISVKPSAYSPPRVTIRQLTGEEESVIKIRMRSKRGVDKKGSADVLNDVRGRANLSTRFPLVALTLAEAEFDTKNWDASAAAARRALELSPNSSEAMIFLGQIAVEKAKKKQGSFVDARKHFKDAQQADPENPLPYYLTYMSYLDEGVAPPEAAGNLLERAYELAPYDRQIRLRVVRYLLARKEGALAGELLSPIAFGAHSSSKDMRELAEMIRTDKLEEAGRKLDELYAKAKAEAEKASVRELR